MLLGDMFDHLTPHQRVVTAVVPFVAAMILRLVLGKGRFSGAVITLATLWFAINILAAPFSARMRDEIRTVGRFLPW